MLPKKSTMMGLFMLSASFFMTGCESDSEAPSTEGFSGRYHVVITEAGVVVERIWEFSQSGSQVNIKDVDILLVVRGTVSGNTVSVPSSTVTISGETVNFEMTLTFSSDGQSFAGTERTTAAGYTVTVAVSGTKI